MQVNVFITRLGGQMQNGLLVLPYGARTDIPQHLRHLSWHNLATTRTDDRLLAAPAAKIEADIAAKGFSVVTSDTPDRGS